MGTSYTYIMERALRVASNYWPGIDLRTNMSAEMIWGILSSGFHQLLAVAFLIATMTYYFFRPILKLIMRYDV